MTRRIALLFCSLLGVGHSNFVSSQEIELLSAVSVSGDALDRSGRSECLAAGVPHNRLGGFSGIEFIGGDRYLILADRGPGDGATDYACRVHEARLTLRQGKSCQVEFELLSTTMLRDEKDRALTGSFAALGPPRSDSVLRFDPEGIRRSPSGMTWLSDEYGPSIVGFDSTGQREQVLTIPTRYKIAAPSAETGKEDVVNKSGRQENRGLEGLAISPDGTRLYGLMQGPLLQDGSRNEKGERAGANCRLLEVNLPSGSTREFVYPLEHGSLGLNEILAINDTEFLVIERDGKEGAEAKAKHIYHIDLAGASDVSGENSLPQLRLSAEVTVKKKLLIDLLDPRFGLSGDKFPQKVEGLTFGPTLADGRRLLIVCTDNDFIAEKASWIYCFALPKAVMGEFGWGY